MSNPRSISNGILAGLVAGLFFAFFLLMNGMTEDLGSIIGMPTRLGGFFVHLCISLIAGIAFVLLLDRLINSWLSATLWGSVFGISMWVLGPMTLQPYLSTDIPLLAQWSISGFDNNKLSLVGHLIYGLVLGPIYYVLKSTYYKT
ncbi:MULTISPECIES: hypothetical protein [unclassified Legionella]|uniref:hypothetical protein n=1 Tax=unclassified Legionella TaxID=2622702 RepID=UPI001E506011|nr:hypothetical protein [Legionella sp. 31fI33]MCC5015235.1 hypothetical protein [Legionella sp. 31fI33]